MASNQVTIVVTLDFSQLEMLLAAYVAAQPDDDGEDMCLSYRSFAQIEADKFLAWLKARSTSAVSNSSTPSNSQESSDKAPSVKEFITRQ